MKTERVSVHMRIVIKMFFRRIYRFILNFSKPDTLVLGRWGYHWETNKRYQKYYD